MSSALLISELRLVLTRGLPCTGRAAESGGLLHVPGGRVASGALPQLQCPLQTVLCHLRTGDPQT